MTYFDLRWRCSVKEPERQPEEDENKLRINNMASPCEVSCRADIRIEFKQS